MKFYKNTNTFVISFHAIGDLPTAHIQTALTQIRINRMSLVC